MSHAVWKLAALAMVVAVGTFVVINAQRGMQGDSSESARDTASAARDGHETADDAEPVDMAPEEAPEQSEPEFALDEQDQGEETVLASAKSARAPGRGRLRASDETEMGDDAFDTDDQSAGSHAAPIDNDPFNEPPERQKLAARSALPVKKPGRGIQVDEDQAITADEDKTADLDDSEPEQPSAPVKSAGPVLSLNDSDAPQVGPTGRDKSRLRGMPGSNLPDKTEPAGPRTIAAERDEPADDPFSEDGLDESPSRLQKKPIESQPDSRASAPAIPRALSSASKSKPARGLNVDDPELEAEESVPAAVPRRASGGPGLPQPDGTIEAEEDEPLELPATASKTPASLGRSIEADDEETPPPARTGSVTRRDSDSEASRRNSPALPGLGDEDADAPQEPDSLAAQSPRRISPQLTIEKRAPATALLGRPMVYDILIRNVGSVPAYQVVVEDVIPRNVQLDGTIPQAQLKEKRLIWKLGNLPAGAEKKIAVRVIPQAEGTVGSVATVNFSPEPRPAAHTAGPQLKFDVLAPGRAIVGSPVEFKFRVKNLGNVPASGVTIRDVLPAALRHPDGDDLEFEIGQLPAGKEREVPLTLTAAQAGPTVNRVVVTADGNVAEEAEVRLEVVGPALKVLRQGPKRLFPEKTGTYSNTVTNPGRGALSGVTVVEAVPAGMEFIDASDGGTFNAAKRSVSWTIGRLAPDESQTVKVKLRSVARGTQISVVRASDSSGASGETVGATQVSGVPALTIEISEMPALIETGETVNVAVRVINRGSDVAGNVRTTIAVPAGMQLVSAEGPVNYRKTNGGGDESPAGIVLEFASISKIDPRADAPFELVLKARSPGEARLKVEARCDQMAESVRREEIASIVTGE